MAFVVVVDSDANAATGDPDDLGAEYAIQFLGGELILFKWDGTGFTARPGDPPQVTLSHTYANGATVRISASELGNSKSFKFRAVVLSGIAIDPITREPDFTNAKSDNAPGGFAGMYPYEIKRGRTTLLVRKFTATPAKPAAGKTFSLRLQAARSDTGALLQGGRVTCIGRVGTSPLRATGRFVGRQAVCSWTIPAAAKGKTFRGTVTIVFEGRKVTRSFSGRIG